MEDEIFYELRYMLGGIMRTEQMETRQDIQQTINIYQPGYFEAYKIKKSKYFRLKENKTKRGFVSLRM